MLGRRVRWVCRATQVDYRAALQRSRACLVSPSATAKRVSVTSCRGGDVSVASITTADVEAWVSDLTAGGLSASRTRQAYLVLKGVLDTAVKARNLAVNPAHGVDLPKV